MHRVICNLNLHGYTPAVGNGDLLVAQKKDCPWLFRGVRRACAVTDYKQKEMVYWGRLCISSAVISCPVDQTGNILGKHFIFPGENWLSFYPKPRLSLSYTILWILIYFPSHGTRQRPQGKNGHEDNMFLQKGEVQQVAALRNIDLQERKELKNEHSPGESSSAPCLCSEGRTDFGPWQTSGAPSTHQLHLENRDNW